MSLGLIGCADNQYLRGYLNYTKPELGEQPYIVGSRPRHNITPFEPSFKCLSDKIKAQNAPILGIGVGDIKDYAGKYSNSEGNSITQGGALMAYTALGKLADVIRVQERFDTRIADLELAYTDRKQLGDGQRHKLEDGHDTNWIPYYGGSILKTDYYIVGGITELNYNIASGGAELNIDLIGKKRRIFVLNIAVDLRIVNTSSMLVAKSVSIEKQLIGEEVGNNVFRFFGSTLVDLNGGQKNEEPLQLGIRTVIEQGILELVSAVEKVNASDCEALAYPAPKATEPSPANAGEVQSGGAHGALAQRAAADVAEPVAVRCGFDSATANTWVATWLNAYNSDDVHRVWELYEPNFQGQQVTHDNWRQSVLNLMSKPRSARVRVGELSVDCVDERTAIVNVRYSQDPADSAKEVIATLTIANRDHRWVVVREIEQSPFANRTANPAAEAEGGKSKELSHGASCACDSKSKEAVQSPVVATTPAGSPPAVGSATPAETSPARESSTESAGSQSSGPAAVPHEPIAPAATPAAAENNATEPVRGSVVTPTVDQSPSKDCVGPGCQAKTDAADALARYSIALSFDANSTTLSGEVVQAISQISLASKQHALVVINVVARDSESNSPTQRYDLTIQRLKLIIASLNSAGVESSRLKLAWIPEVTDNTVYRDSSGYQKLATLQMDPPP